MDLEQALAEQHAIKRRSELLSAYIDAQRQAQEAQRKADELAAQLSPPSAQAPLSSATLDFTVAQDCANETKSNKIRAGENVNDRARLRAVIADYLKQGPMPAKQIVERLAQDGIELRGKDKITTISQILTGQTNFVPDRKIGWSLATNSQKGEDPAATGSSDATNAPVTGLTDKETTT